MFDWMFQSREEFLLNYFDIGNSHGTSKELQEDHKHFSLSSMDMYVTVNRLLSLAGRLLDGRHFASASIRQVALVLEKGWKEFASLLDLRTQVLGLSVTFHQKADQYVSSVPVWSAQCDDIGTGQTSASATDGMLESAIHQHQSQYELMCLNYTEVHSTSKKLLYQLDHLVQLANQNKSEPPTDKQVISWAYYISPDGRVVSVADWQSWVPEFDPSPGQNFFLRSDSNNKLIVSLNSIQFF